MVRTIEGTASYIEYMAKKATKEAMQRPDISKQTIVRANDRMVHKSRTKALKTCAKAISERMQNDGIVAVPTNNIEKSNSLFQSETIQKIKTKLTWENFKKLLVKKK